jgi:CRP-like cAMP-binding protein
MAAPAITERGATVRRRHDKGEVRRRADVAATIRSWPQARDIPAQEIRALSELVQDVTLPADWTFITQGTPADATYLLLEGRARVVHNGAGVADLGPGSVIGEMALANRALRSASVITTQPSRLLHMSAEAFEIMRTRCPHATRNWLAYATERARELATLPSQRVAGMDLPAPG